MKNNAIQQMNRGMDVCPIAKDRAISALVMRCQPRPEDVNHAFPYGAPDTEENTISNAIAAARAKINADKGLLMAGLI